MAFLRRLGDASVLVVAPRLTTSSLSTWPLGAEYWADTRVTLPETVPTDTFYNVLTGEVCRFERREGVAQMRIGDALKVLPIGLFINVSALTPSADLNEPAA